MIVACFETHSESDTKALAAIVESACPPSVVVGLVGTLGAGKTAFVRGFAESCGVDPLSVTSPTFTLCNEYQGSRRVNHFDTYRLDSENDFIDLGVEEQFGETAVTFVEWADRVNAVMPSEAITIRFEVCSESTRRITISGSSAAARTAIEQIKERAVDLLTE